MTVWRELHACCNYAWAGWSGCADSFMVLVRVRCVWNRSERTSSSSWEMQGWLWVSFVLQSSSRIHVPLYIHSLPSTSMLPTHTNPLPSQTRAQITLPFAQLPHVRRRIQAVDHMPLSAGHGHGHWHGALASRSWNRTWQN